jgi:MFS family permease
LWVTTATGDGFRFGSIAVPALIPSFLFGIGEGAVVPIVPAVASALGADLAGAGLIVAMLVVGQLAGDIPSGALVARVGERAAMIAAALLSVAAMAVALLAPAPAVLGIAVFALGLSASTFALARQAFMTTFVPVRIRARALSTLGGAFRGGMLVGPFLGAGLIALTGTVETAFAVQIAAGLGVTLLLLVMRDPMAVGARAARAQAESVTSAPAAAPGLFTTIWQNRGALVRVGSGAGVVGALRASRMSILPLWAISIGVDPQTTAVVIGIGAAADFALFYTSGQIMDRFGRLWSVIPSMAGMSLALIALAFTHDLGGAVAWFVVISIWLGVANGVGSGIIMTLSADLAPSVNPAPFLGAFRFTADAGAAAAPLLVSAIVLVASLPLAAAAMGVVGVAGAGILWRNIPRYVPHRPRASS